MPRPRLQNMTGFNEMSSGHVHCSELTGAKFYSIYGFWAELQNFDMIPIFGSAPGAAHERGVGCGQGMLIPIWGRISAAPNISSNSLPPFAAWVLALPPFGQFLVNVKLRYATSLMHKFC